MKDTPQPLKAPPLQFEDDSHSSRSKWVAGALVAALILWMGSGFILPSATEEPEAPVTRQLVTVAVEMSAAQKVTRYFTSEGQALPDRETELQSEISGRIEQIERQKGAKVQAGALIVRFETEQRDAALVQANEEMTRTKREFENAEALLKRGAATMDRVAAARAAYAQAKAEVSRAQREISATQLIAPFDGRLEELSIAQGEFVQAGTVIGKIVDTTPLTIAVQIPQQALRQLKLGMVADVRFITGEERKGKVTFLGSSADTQTRTFLAEISVENEDAQIPAGISAEIRIPVDKTDAHFLSPAILSLDADGILGIKTVEKDDIVAFHAVQIVRARTDGVWVSGLPPEARIITIGQGFVNDGEKVAPQAATASDKDQEAGK